MGKIINVKDIKMQVFIKNKIFSLGGSSVVVTADNRPVYNIKGKVFSPTRKKFVKDLNGNKLYSLRNKWFNWFVHKVFIYDAEGNRIATVKDKFFNPHKEYFVEGAEDNIRTEGEFFSFSTTIYRNDVAIGRIDRQITFIADAFCLEAPEHEIPFLIALVIAIDNITDKIRG